IAMKNQGFLPQTDNAAWEQTISSWVDGENEVRPQELDSPYGRQVWDTYHLIGDVLRSDELAILPSNLFYARVSKQIDAEPTVLAPQRKRPLVRYAVPAVALLFVASAAWMSLPFFESTTSSEPALQVASAPLPENPVSDYIEAHREL